MNIITDIATLETSDYRSLRLTCWKLADLCADPEIQDVYVLLVFENLATKHQHDDLQRLLLERGNIFEDMMVMLDS